MFIITTNQLVRIFQAKDDDGGGISDSVEENRKDWNICIQRLTDLTSLEDFLRIGHFNDAESPPASSCCEKLSIKGQLNFYSVLKYHRGH